MALINYTSPNVNNTAVSDAIKHYGQIGASGIFKIEGATLTATSNGGTITFGKGYASIQGRFLEMEQGTTFAITMSGGAYGYVCLTFNWQTEEASIVNIEGSTSYPSLTQDNMIASNDGTYQLPICKYTRTSTTITIEELEDTYYIEAYNDKLKNLEARVDAMGFEEFEIENLSPDTISISYSYGVVSLTKIGNRVTGYLSVQTNGFTQTPSGTKIFKIPSKFIPKNKIIRGYASGSSVTLNIADDGTYTTTKLLSVSSGYATVISSYVWWEIDI